DNAAPQKPSSTVAWMKPANIIIVCISHLMSKRVPFRKTAPGTVCPALRASAIKLLRIRMVVCASL
ncbi:MAG: hypothetical protein QX188_05180, partial [Methylococcaceae bacterium]